jgi:hypothetical protein
VKPAWFGLGHGICWSYVFLDSRDILFAMVGLVLGHFSDKGIILSQAEETATVSTTTRDNQRRWSGAVAGRSPPFGI